MRRLPSYFSHAWEVIADGAVDGGSLIPDCEIAGLPTPAAVKARLFDVFAHHAKQAFTLVAFEQ